MVGISSSSALMMVQLRPPNVATANVYGSRSTAPTSVGTAVSRNLPAGSMPYSGPRNSTSTDHMLQTEKPMCSETTEKIRLRLAIGAPVLLPEDRVLGAPVVDPVPAVAVGDRRSVGRRASSDGWVHLEGAISRWSVSGRASEPVGSDQRASTRL